jgi:uncharacterized protein with GYD domain
MTVLESCSAERQHSGRRGRYFCLVIHEADEPDPDARSADGSARARLPPKGAKGLANEGGSGRRAATARLVESAGGKLDAFFFAFLGVDAYIIVDLLDNVAADAAVLAGNQIGAVATKTVVLLTPEEIDEAVRKPLGFRGPGH